MEQHNKLTDADLLALLKLGKEDAFVVIYHRYWECLINAAYQRLRSRSDAEEVVQEVFVNLYLRRNEIEPKSTLEAYLKTALKYKVIDMYRLQQLHYKHIDNLIAETQVNPQAADDELAIREFKLSVLSACQKLPQKCREVFIMFRFEELSHKEIALRTSISVSTVKKHLHKAMFFLREEFKGSKTFLTLVFWYLFYK
ncbi:RNA polymerase sigma-70 factor [Pedobacter sp. HDW13]|uniref:RNA polymerase sigma factor n=1 Tax=Pedobacter sp. HDW13 TaxID=2714940 RepID=UPI00140BD16D|nr:RNA polymerase sigma-70 factor [Pedobacter sp. HDW13]QIL40349.1 RNA polymerase sigma-70 factor [Pedobacter sp. HDW13]